MSINNDAEHTSQRWFTPRPVERAMPRTTALDLDQPPSAPEPPNIEQLGKITADAVRAQHEAAAHAVESLGKEVVARINSLEAALVQCHEDLKLIAEAAEAIRKKGDLVSQQVEDAASLSNNIRNTCTDFKTQLSSG